MLAVWGTIDRTVPRTPDTPGPEILVETWRMRSREAARAEPTANAPRRGGDSISADSITVRMHSSMSLDCPTRSRYLSAAHWLRFDLRARLEVCKQLTSNLSRRRPRQQRSRHRTTWREPSSRGMPGSTMKPPHSTRKASFKHRLSNSFLATRRWKRTVTGGPLRCGSTKRAYADFPPSRSSERKAERSTSGPEGARTCSESGWMTKKSGMERIVGMLAAVLARGRAKLDVKAPAKALDVGETAILADIFDGRLR